MSVDIRLQNDVERKAKELFEIARPCFHYAPPNTPDGLLFSQSTTATMLMNAMRRIAASVLESKP